MKVAIIGCGLMGIKIAGELALHGHHVALHDTDRVKLDFAKESLEKDKWNLIKLGFPSFLFKKGTVLYLDNLQLTVQNANFIFEAIVEDLESKRNLFKEISACCPGSTIMCSGTMSLDLDSVVEFVENRERTVGVRFLYPVLCIPEVEVTGNSFTSREVLDIVHKFLQDMGKHAILRRGKDPILLTDDEAASRRNACLESMVSAMLQPISSSSSSSSSSPSPLPLKLILEPSLLSSSTPATPLTLKANSVESSSSPLSRECAICMDAERDTLLCPCRHLITCSSCSWSLIINQEPCPICRASIQEILHVFHS